MTHNSGPSPRPSVQHFLSLTLVNYLLLLSCLFIKFSFSFITLMLVVLFPCHVCLDVRLFVRHVSHVISLTLLLRHLFSTSQTNGCSCANIHEDYYFISLIVIDDRHI